VLGAGAFIPAVGGVIRPGLVARLKGARGMIRVGVPSKGRLMQDTLRLVRRARRGDAAHRQ
jgi:hypothetical protein